MIPLRERLAIAIITFGRPRELRRCLLSLAEAALSAPFDLELHLAVNGPDSATARALEELRAEWAGPPLSVLLFPSPLQPGAARNRLLARQNPTSGSQWVFFIDDDAYVGPEFFSDFERTRISVPSAEVIGGPNITPPESSLFQRSTGLALCSKLATFFSFPRYRPCGLLRRTDERELSLCNLFFRSDLLKEASFPEFFVCGEESWLLRHLEAEGRRLVYDPRLQVWHDRRPTPWILARQVFRYGAGRALHLRKRPGDLRLAHVVPTVCVLFTTGAWAGLPWTSQLFCIWLVFFFLYAALCLEESIRMTTLHDESISAWAVTMILFPWIHGAYGLGFAWGTIAGRAS